MARKLVWFVGMLSIFVSGEKFTLCSIRMSIIIDLLKFYRAIFTILSNVVIDASMSLALIMVAIREWKNG